MNALAVTSDGEISAADADGVVSLFTSDGMRKTSVETQEVPITSLALSADGSRIAAASIGGTITVIDRRAAKVLFQIAGTKQPVWALAFRPDGRELLSGGNDRLIRRWNAATGEPIGSVAETASDEIPAELAGERGAEVFHACAACHTLKRDAENRAGPSLNHVFGRRIATAPRLQLFAGPEEARHHLECGDDQQALRDRSRRYTPGTKMPEQRIENRRRPRGADTIPRKSDYESMPDPSEFLVGRGRTLTFVAAPLGKIILAHADLRPLRHDVRIEALVDAACTRQSSHIINTRTRLCPACPENIQWRLRSFSITRSTLSGCRTPYRIRCNGTAPPLL